MTFRPAQLTAARDYAALVIAKHGDAYLPLFERLECEVAKLEKKEDALARALRLAQRQLAD